MTTKINHCGYGLRCAKNMEMETKDLEYGPTQGVTFVVIVNVEVMYSSNCVKLHK